MQIISAFTEAGKVAAPLAALGYAIRHRPTLYDVVEAVQGVRHRVREQVQAVCFEEPQQMHARALPRWIKRSKSCTAKVFTRYYAWAQKRWIDEAVTIGSLMLNVLQAAAIYGLVRGYFDQNWADAIRYYAIQCGWARTAIVRCFPFWNPLNFMIFCVCLYYRGLLFQRRLDAEKAAPARVGEMEE